MSSESRRLDEARGKVVGNGERACDFYSMRWRIIRKILDREKTLSDSCFNIVTLAPVLKTRETKRGEGGTQGKQF